MRNELPNLPSSVRTALAESKAEMEALIRRTRWGEGPVYLVGSGAAVIPGLTGRLSFETWLGRPGVAREAGEFQAYCLSVLEPRSVVLAISYGPEADETLEAARSVRRRGGTLLVLTADPKSELAALAHGVFLVHNTGTPATGFTLALCCHTILSYLGLFSARILRKPHPEWDKMLAEFDSFPEQVEWVLRHLQDALRSFGSELEALKGLEVAAAGFYKPAALEWAHRFAAWAPTRATVLDWNAIRGPGANQADVPLLLLSGSRCRMKRAIRDLGALRKRSGQRILSVTDRNDQELARLSSLALLLPPLGEPLGSLVALIALTAAVCESGLKSST